MVKGRQGERVRYIIGSIRDRTEDLKDSAHRAALSLGFNEAKIAAVMASFIMHKPRQRFPFTKAGLKTLESIGALEQFLMRHKKDYVDRHRTTERERDGIEHEVIVFIKACKDQIDILKSSINEDESTSKGWLGVKSDGLNVDTIAHKHGVEELSRLLDAEVARNQLNLAFKV